MQSYIHFVVNIWKQINADGPLPEVGCTYIRHYANSAGFLNGGNDGKKKKSEGKRGPELSPRKSGRCARFARPTPCQYKKMRLFLPSDAQNRERQVGRVNHKP